ncbi:UDP-N-acetylenolpyruvoylglucosamine reductase [Candidatus Saccharibacteria bacterium 32-50-10]|nr:MAG: UDP-N-acetylenolpyruvoylglucosamine reductase [Candidatus Saccharibacteria bacterium 32-50-10]
MDIHTDIPLKNFTTMRLGGNARFMVDVHTPNDVAAICKRATEQSLPIFVLGGGSNTLVHDEGFAGIVVHNRIPGFHVISETPSDATLKIGAGESWDEVVRRSVEMNLTGIEALSAIPGSAGAAPVQNIGAYGQEIAETLVEVEAYDIQENRIVVLTNEACQFSYRYSIFRGEQTGRYVILSITLKLYRAAPQPPFYKAVQEYLDLQNITLYTPQVIRDAVIAIRSEKLPDPKIQPNTGSFFKNAIIEDWQLNDLRNEYPDIPTYDMPDGRFKVPTGWLIEQAGLKGQVLHGMKVHDKNALVLINESATSYADLAAARDEIIGAVRDKFRIQIEQEPLEM